MHPGSELSRPPKESRGIPCASFFSAGLIVLVSTLLLTSAMAQENEAETDEKSPVMHVRDNVKKPVRLSGENPQYSKIAKEARLQGTVILEAIIDQNGDVTRVRPIKSLPLELTDNAIASVKTWKYEPATLEGKPVSVYYQLTINFRLNGEKKPSDDGAETDQAGS